jgi:hypothetical protein
MPSSGEGKSDGEVKTGKQLCEGLVLAADEHRDGEMFVCGGGYAADGVNDAEGDFASLDQAGEMRQEIRDRVADAGWFRTLLQDSASGCEVIDESRLRAKFQDKSSSMRRMGGSADVCEQMAQVGFRIEFVELGRLDQPVASR